MPSHTMDINSNGVLNICQAVLLLDLKEKTRIFHASTSEMFGELKEKGDKILIDEDYPFNPMSPYAASKISAYYILKFFKNVHNFHICTTYGFNHESPLRHEEFVTRKITKAVARIKVGLQSKLLIGNLYAMRDWGHAKDFVRAYWLILISGLKDDFVVSTE